MKIVVIGGTGLIGSKLVNKLREMGHGAVPASPDTGVNTLTGEGLSEALAGAQVVVDVSNSPSFEEKAVMEFFTTSTRNLLAAEKAASVGHHVALCIVGTDRLPESGYFRAKMAQENLIKASQVPYTILRSTQFFEFVSRIATTSPDGKAFTPHLRSSNRLRRTTSSQRSPTSPSGRPRTEPWKSRVPSVSTSTILCVN